MEWTKKEPQIGDKRIIKKFLLIPKNLNGKVKWLEFAKIKQEYNFYGYEGLFVNSDWLDLEWG